MSLHPFGCRVIQKAIDYLKDKPLEQIKFMEEIENYYLELIENQNGNHVIQKCLEVFSHDKIENLVNIFVKNVT